MSNIDYADLQEKATEVLKMNDRGRWTVPAGELYPHQWLWDSCFIAIGRRHLDINRAQTELRSLIRGQWSDGMIPDMVFAAGQASHLDRVLWDSIISPFAPANVATSGITQPPMIAEAAVQIGKLLKSEERKLWYKEIFPAITNFHQWMYDERDPNNEGLITLVHPYESGLDNSPPWIDELHAAGIPVWVKALDKLRLINLVSYIRRDVRHSTLDQRMTNKEALAFWVALRRLRHKSYSSVLILERPYLAVQDLAFNSILARSNTALQEIAKAIGQELPDTLITNIQLTRDALERLWDVESGQYYSRSFTRDELIAQPTIATFLPLYSGAISKDRASELVKLLDSQGSYKTNWPVPSVPTDSAYFDASRYWQGPTWINMNWMIIKGLRDYGFDEPADKLKSKTLELVNKNGFGEYFNPQTGAPLGAQHFSWSAALAIDLLND